ncbi:MAG: hypothetical protein WD534_14000 [Phycisphaeraceae bacterium]
MKLIAGGAAALLFSATGLLSGCEDSGELPPALDDAPPAEQPAEQPPAEQPEELPTLPAPEEGDGGNGDGGGGL